VAKLARWHMEHGRIKKCSRPETILQKMEQIHEDIEGRVPFATLLKLMSADMRGCTGTGIPLPRQKFDLIEEFKAHAKDHGLYEGPIGALACSYGQEYAEESDDEENDPTYKPERKKRRLAHVLPIVGVTAALGLLDSNGPADSPMLLDAELPA